MESNDRDVSPEEAAEARKMAEKLGMRIHSVLRGWTNFNSPDAARWPTTSPASRRPCGPPRATGPTPCCWSPAASAGCRCPSPGSSTSSSTRRPATSAAWSPGRQRQVRGLHRGPEPRHRRLPQGRREADPRGREDRRGHRPGKRLEQPLGQAGAVRQLHRLVRQPLGAVLLRHRQPREVRHAGGVDPRAGQADRQDAT